MTAPRAAIALELGSPTPFADIVRVQSVGLTAPTKNSAERAIATDRPLH